MEKDEAYDIYSREGFVSVNPDGSDRKLIFFHHDGETSTSEEYALGDWIYFKYQCDKLARMKNDGSAFKVLHTFSGDSFFISGTKDNRLYHYTDACPRMYGIILRRIALFRWICLLY